MFEWFRKLFRPKHNVSTIRSPVEFVETDDKGTYVICVENVPMEIITPANLEEFIESHWDEAKEKRYIKITYTD